MQKNDQTVAEFLQTRMDSRKLRGFDKLVANCLPSWIDEDNYDGIPEYAARKMIDKKNKAKAKKKKK